jgi:predicted metal-dependent peptidase
MLGRLAELVRGFDRKDSSRGLQAARLRAAYERAYFAPALFNLIPVSTDQIASMAVDSRWRLYYNDKWIAAHSVEENAAVLLHEVSHLLRDHEARKHAAGAKDERLWNTATDYEINDDLLAEGLPLPHHPPTPEKFGLENGEQAESYYRHLLTSTKEKRESEKRSLHGADCGSGAHGQRRSWEMPDDDGSPNRPPAVDSVKAQLVRREVARRILDRSGDAGDAPRAWKHWARAVLEPRVDYLATMRHVVRKALRESTLGRYDRTFARPHRRQAAYGTFLMPSFHQPRPRPGFLIDTSGSMRNAQLARAVTELAALTRQLGHSDVVVACCDAMVHDVRRVMARTQLELIGGGGTNMGAGIQWFADKTTIDLLIIVSDCITPWPAVAPRFPVVTIRVGEGPLPPWSDSGMNTSVTIHA